MRHERNEHSDLLAGSGENLGTYRAGVSEDLRHENVKAETIRIEKSKTDRARSVSIIDPLPAWFPSERKGRIFDLKPAVKDREAVWLEAMDSIKAKAEVELPQNVFRHCFGSYHYAKERDAARTAFEMGNSPAIVRRHYADAVDSKEAEIFWILSTAVAENILKPKKPGMVKIRAGSVRRRLPTVD